MTLMHFRGLVIVLQQKFFIDIDNCHLSRAACVCVCVQCKPAVWHNLSEANQLRLAAAAASA